MNSEQPQPQMRPSKTKRSAALGLLAIAAAVLIYISVTSSTAYTGKPFTRGSTIVIATKNGPTTYFNGAETTEGFEYDLAERFAKFYKLNTEYLVLDSISDVLSAVENGEADIAAAGLTKTAARDENFSFSPSYMEVEEYLVCNRHETYPDHIDELHLVNIVVTARSTYAARLEQIAQQQPNLNWSTSELSTEQLLYQVSQKTGLCTVADSTIVDVHQRYMTDLKKVFAISQPQPLAWLIQPEQRALSKKLANFFHHDRTNLLIETLTEHYFGHIEQFDYVDLSRYKRRISSRLPKYAQLFKKAALKYDLDWQLLAAQSYQESHWQPKAKSPTGVRGMMMLTLTTAKSVGVKNRLDARQSITGGARYLRRLFDRVDEEIPADDKIYFALAAYNVGGGHMHDAQTLARSLNLNPHRWADIKSVLPLLTQEKYYKKLKYGYARGHEPVQYVDRIKDYYDILQFVETENNRPK